MRILACAMLGALILATAPLAGTVEAQTTGPAPAAKAAKGAKGQPAAPGEAAKADPAAAERAMESGIKSYEAGKNDVAAQALSTAMQGGALPGPKMARALYYRGLAYKKQGKPAQAISDLTSALWLKGGLSEAERTDALAQRETAYREAGIAQAPAVTTTAAKTAPAATSVAATAAAAPAAAAKPAETASTSSSGGFFSNLFGGSSTTSPPPAAAGASSATGSVSSPPPEPAASSWNSGTKASTGAKPTAKPTEVAAAAAASAAEAPASLPAKAPAAAPTKVAAPTPAAPAASPPASVADGKFRLQVAAVRSRAEADTIAARLKKDFAKKIGGRQPVIDEAVIGNMGTFYRVRVGPYANANEPRQLCITLRASGGFDCLVVTQ